MASKKLTLHKANELTRGGDGLSVHAKRALNAIYYVIQHNVQNGNRNAVEREMFMKLDFSFLRKMMSLEKTESYIKEIQDALIELQETTIQLNNFRSPQDGELYQWFSISFLSDARWKLEDGKRIAYISIAPFMKWLMIHTHDNGNFTELELIPTVNKLRTKYSMKLYEYLKSFKAFRYIDITQKHMMKFLGFEEDHETYKNYSALKRLLERQLKEISKKTDLPDVKLIDNKLLSKEKKYRIIINPKSKRDVNKLEAKTALENLLQKIRF